MARGQRGVDLASAFVTIVPSLKGAQGQIQEQLSGIDLTPTGSKLGEQLSGSIGRSMDLKTIGARLQDVGGQIESVGRSLTNKITKPALIAAGAVGGLVAGLGFKRLVSLDRAEAQFRGLGLEVEAVMEQVGKGVTDTALSMADGATLAVSALATGNLPLKDLEDQIKRVANVSAAYGIEAEHAGYLLNNILTKNKVTWGDLAQMQQNNIPIVSMLADEFGVAGDAIMKMAQDGEISIEDLNRVLDKNAGAAAEEYAKSWDGIRANIVSNIGKIGAAFLEGVFPQAKEEMENFLEKLRSPEWTEKARELGEKVAAGFEALRTKIRELVAAWDALDPATQDWIKKVAIAAIVAGPLLIVIGKIATVVGTVATGLGAVVGWLGSGGLLRAIPRVLGPIGLIAAGLWAVYENSEELQDAVSKLWDTLKEAWEKIWPALEPVLTSMADLFEKIAPLVGDVLVAAIEAAVPAIELFVAVAVPALEATADAIEWMMSVLDTEEWGLTWEVITGITGSGLGVLTTMMKINGFLIEGDWKGLFGFLVDEANRRFPNLMGIFARAGENFRRTIGNALDWIKTNWGIDLRGMAATASERWEEIKTGAQEKFNELVIFITSIPTRIRNIFSNAWTWLKQAGRDVLEGFKKGLQEKWNDIKQWFTNLTNMLPSWKGPADVDRVILRDAGRLVIGGFIDGMESQYHAARRSLTGFTSSMAAGGAGGFGAGGFESAWLSIEEVIERAVERGAERGTESGSLRGGQVSSQVLRLEGVR